MIEEAYCSFEIAKLLKEKGFGEYCYMHYEEDGSQYISDEEPGDCISAPTHQMTMRWLREVHHYYIQVMLDSWALGGHSGYYIIIQRTDNDFEMMLQDAVDEVFYQTYEEAVEAALKYTLENLI